MLTLFLSVLNHACVHAQSLQLCPTLCDPMDCSPLGPLSMGILQARTLVGLLFLPPGDLPDPGVEPRSPALQADSSLSELPGKPLYPSVYSNLPTGLCPVLQGR